MRFLAFIFLTGLLALASCAAPAVKSYSYTPPATPGGRLCTNQCGEARDYCRETCDLKQRQCVTSVQMTAMHDYDQYTRNQFATHQPIEFRPRDFERSDACDGAKNDCREDCEDHYKVCYENCGGGVSTTSTCRFLCF